MEDWQEAAWEWFQLSWEFKEGPKWLQKRLQIAAPRASQFAPGLSSSQLEYLQEPLQKLEQVVDVCSPEDGSGGPVVPGMVLVVLGWIWWSCE